MGWQKPYWIGWVYKYPGGVYVSMYGTDTLEAHLGGAPGTFGAGTSSI
jgi:hypothetical protein